MDVLNVGIQLSKVVAVSRGLKKNFLKCLILKLILQCQNFSEKNVKGKGFI